MSSTVSRNNSFKNWIYNHIQDPAGLVQCGFYYIGEKDKVHCFHCGVGLYNWEVNDSPWVEHAINSPLCPYLLLNKHKASGKLPQEPNKRLIVCHYEL